LSDIVSTLIIYRYLAYEHLEQKNFSDPREGGEGKRGKRRIRKGGRELL
jgi:hypothetical protein